MECCGAVVKQQIQDNELASWRVRPQWVLSVVSLSKTSYPHCLVLASTQEYLHVNTQKMSIVQYIYIYIYIERKPQIGCFFNQEVLIFFLFLHENMLWYSLEVHFWCTSNKYRQYMFLWRNKKNIYPLLSKATCSLLSVRWCMFYDEQVKGYRIHFSAQSVVVTLLLLMTSHITITLCPSAMLSLSPPWKYCNT